MKEILSIILITILLGTSTVMVLAAENPTPTSAPTKTLPGDSLTKEITNLKEKIASRVAELKLVEKRGIIGSVTEVKDTQFTLTDSKGNMKFVDVDELTKFSGIDSKTSFGISDIKKGMTLAVLGRYNKQSERLLARFVNQISLPTFLSGTVTEIDSENFSFVLKTTDGKTLNIDVENITKTKSYSKKDGVSKAGFSKLQTGDSIVLSGFPDKKDPSRIVATRIIILMDFSKTENNETTIKPTKPSIKSSSAKQ